MEKGLRAVEVSPPEFDTLEEALEYSQRFQHSQAFIDDFLNRFNDKIRFSAPPIYDSRLWASGSAVITENCEAIKIGKAGLVRDSELFKTLIHEEMHLRLMRKARKDYPHALEIVTSPASSIEEVYVERIAVRYLGIYERAHGKLKH